MRPGDSPLGCEQVRERLDAFVDGELGAAEADAVRVHLEDAPGCAGCRTQLELARAVRDGLRGLPELTCPGRVVEQALARAGAARQLPGPTRRAANDHEPEAGRWDHAPEAGRWWSAALLAAAAGLLLALGLLAFGALRSADRVPAGARVAATPDAEPGSDGEIDAEELARATEEARLALAYVASIGRRSALTLRDEVVGRKIVRPSARALQRALDPLWPETAPAASAPKRRGDPP